MTKNFLVSLSIVARMDDKSQKYYADSPADLHEALTMSENAKITMTETDAPHDELWGEEPGEAPPAQGS